MSEHVHTKLLYLNSKDRTNGIAENYEVNFNNTMSQNIFKVSLKEAVIPNTMYNVTPFNNIIIVQGITYTLTPGQYDITQFILALQTLLAVYTLVITIDPNTFRMIFTTTGAVTYSSIANGTTMGKLIGMDPINNLTTASSPMLNIYNLSGPMMLFIYSNILSGTNTNMIQPSGYVPAMGNVIVNAPFGQNITFELQVPETDSIDFDSYQNIRSMRIQLVNDSGNQVDLNGSDYILVLKILMSSHR
jgi:hypothetical protein